MGQPYSVAPSVTGSVFNADIQIIFVGQCSRPEEALLSNTYVALIHIVLTFCLQQGLLDAAVLFPLYSYSILARSPLYLYTLTQHYFTSQYR